LSERILAAEHKLYPHALKLVASGTARVDGETVRYASADIERTLFF
jgi:phosphoribosylglycinamide formyltransferase-1